MNTLRYAAWCGLLVAGLAANPVARAQTEAAPALAFSVPVDNFEDGVGAASV